MPVNPLERAIKSGVRMNGRIGDLFAKVGTSAHPRGEILSTYRRSRVALKSALGERNRMLAAQDVLRGMRSELQGSISSLFAESIALGDDEARRQLDFYGRKSNASINLTTETQAAFSAVISRFDAQAAAVRALIATDADEAQIIGDENRDGVLSASEVAAGMSYWIAYLVWGGFGGVVSGSQGLNFEKQAIAAIDMRTTNCCLKVHGQVQPFNKPFELKGTPRFADQMDWPGFHYFCRTSAVLYVAEFDDGITAKLRADALKYLK